jgi:hypothetical protein
MLLATEAPIMPKRGINIKSITIIITNKTIEVNKLVLISPFPEK